MKKPLFIPLILLLCLALTGCWNYTETDSLSIVVGVGIDLDPQNGDFILNIEIAEPNSGTKESAIESKLIESRGQTMFEAERNAIAISGQRFLWGHARILILSEEVAGRGVLDILDWFYRDAEPRLTFHFLVAQDASAKEVISSKPSTNSITAFEIFEALQNENDVEEYADEELYQIVQMLKSQVPYAIMPRIILKKGEEEMVCEVRGLAVFKGDKLVGFLDGEDTKYLLYVLNNINGGLITYPDVDGIPNANICLEVFNNTTTVEPIYSEGKFTIKIHTKTEAGIGESTLSADFMDKADVVAIQEKMQLFLQQNILRVIRKVQDEFDADIFGFGETIYQNMPNVWKEYKNNWDVEFKELSFEISSEIKIRNSAQARKSLKEAG